MCIRESVDPRIMLGFESTSNLEILLVDLWIRGSLKIPGCSDSFSKAKILEISNPRIPGSLNLPIRGFR